VIAPFGMDRSQTASPLDACENAISALHGEGAQVVFNSAKAHYFTDDGNKSDAFDVTAHIRLRALHHEMSIWFAPRQMQNAVAFQIEGTDVLGDRYLVQFQIRSSSSGATVVAVHGNVLFLRGERTIREQKRIHVAMPMPRGVAYPFSSVTEVQRKCGQALLGKKGYMDGYYGAISDVAVDIHLDGEHYRLDAYHDVDATPERLAESVEMAISYALGVMADPEYICIERGDSRTIFIRPGDQRKLIDQSASPINRRLGASELILLFEKVFRFCLRNPDELLPKEVGLFVDVYRTFEGGYLSLQLLHLCIAIEALLRMGSELSLEDKFAEEEVKKIHEALDGVGLPDAKRSRLSALLSQLNAASIMYLFDRLIDAEELMPLHKKAFKRHRSILAHGAEIKGERGVLRADRTVLISAFHLLFIRMLDTA